MEEVHSPGTPASHEFHLPRLPHGLRWADCLWLAYLAWALPYFAIKYWPVLSKWFGGQGHAG